MVLDSKIQKVRDFYAIHSLDDWRKVTPADVTFIEGVGRATLNHIRLFLAARGLTLKDDRTPEHWNEHLGKAKVGGQSIADEEVADVCPFTIVVDVNESLPFQFDGIPGRNGSPLLIKTERLPLYRYGLADYTIRGLEQGIQIERKGDDLPSSLAQRRDEFEAEIHRLDQTCEFAAIVVEHEWSEILGDQHEHGASAKSIARTHQSWSIKYPRVHWMFCAGRAHAEVLTFRLLEKFWQLKQEEKAAEAAIQRQHNAATMFAPV